MSDTAEATAPPDADAADVPAASRAARASSAAFAAASDTSSFAALTAPLDWADVSPFIAASAAAGMVPPPELGTPLKFTWKKHDQLRFTSPPMMVRASEPSSMDAEQFFLITLSLASRTPRSTVMLVSPPPELDESTMFKPPMLFTCMMRSWMTMGTVT